MNSLPQEEVCLLQKKVLALKVASRWAFDLALRARTGFGEHISPPVAVRLAGGSDLKHQRWQAVLLQIVRDIGNERSTHHCGSEFIRERAVQTTQLYHLEIFRE